MCFSFRDVFDMDQYPNRYPFPGLDLYEATLEAMERERKTFHYDINDFDRDPLAWSMPLDNHHCGQFSMAAVQSNVNIEDHGEVKVGDGALFVGVYDGYNGDAVSNYIRNHIFQTLLSESCLYILFISCLSLRLHACVFITSIG
jgi:hypothetical protein